MHKGKILFFLLLLSGGMQVARGQVYAPSADDSLSTAYNPSSADDIIYVFNRPSYQDNINASILALSPDRTEGWTFTWSRFNEATGSYIGVPGGGSGSSSAIDTISVSSGYRMVMTRAAESHTYRVWLVFNDYDVRVTNKDNEDKILFGYYNCASLDLRADTSLVPLTYRNPSTNELLYINTYYTIRWTTDNPEASNPSSQLITRVYNPPSADTWYILTLTDRFGLKRLDSAFYESIQSKAVLSATYVNLSDTSAYFRKDYGFYYDDGIKSAPGKYRFNLSGSENAAYYSIDFGDGQTYETASASERIIHEYILPGEYMAVLTTKSDAPYECIDTVSATAELVYAAFEMPNVFSPNDDGENDILTLYEDNNLFRSQDVSVVTIDITIFDRSGTRMHTYHGHIRDWRGWDGKVMNSNRNAPEGVYYYVISFLYAFEEGDQPISKEVMKGFFHLFRQ